MATALNHLSTAFADFHSTGVKHYESACQVLEGLQEVASVCEHASGTLATPLSQVRTCLGN